VNWLVIGAGAIGSVVGGLLARSGEKVWLLGRPWHLDVIRRDGLQIRGILGEHRVTHCELAVDPQQLSGKSWDVILVTVKSYDTLRAADQLSVLLTPQTRVVSLQNGLGNWEALGARVPRQQMIGGRVIFGVELEPGAATVTVWGGDILLGGLTPDLPREQVQLIADRLTAAGLRAQVTDRIREALWSKVIYNCSLNPLSTILGIPYGQLLESKPTRRLMEQVIEEAYELAQAEGIHLEPPTAGAYRAELFERLIPLTAAHHPSMLQDLRRGRRTEIGALNGALVAMGQRHRIPTPVNGFLTDLVWAKESLV